MQVRSLAAAFALGFAAVISASSPATADSHQPVEIVAHPCSFTPEFGPWSSASDSGSYLRTEVASSPPNAPPFQQKTYREEFVFSGQLGTFTVHAEERTSLPPPQVGIWQIAPRAGTGAYTGATGHGEAFFTIAPGPSCFGQNFLFTFTLRGVMKMAA